MKITLSLDIDGKEVTRSYEVESPEMVDYHEEINDIIDTLLDDKEQF